MGNIGRVNFYLKNPKEKGESLLNLHYHFTGIRFKFSTGLKVHPRQWNADSQRIKKGEGSVDANNYLKKIENALATIHLRAVSAGKEVTSAFLRVELLKAIGKGPQSPKGFFDFLREYYQIQESRVAPNYLKRILTLTNHLKEFERVKRHKLSFSNIDLAFYDQFTTYLMKDKRHLNNTIGSNISTLKTFLIWATSRGYNTNLKFKDRAFKKVSNESDIIYLTQEELNRLFELDLSNNQRLKNVRETFCFACFTGLRFSDVTRIKEDNITNDELKITTTKTKKGLIIPLSEYALEILNRNDNKLPVISNQKMNDYLKELCKLAEFNEVHTVTKFRGKERIEIKEPKYNLVSSHTARRTFVTISLLNGMRIETVMEITGHSSYQMMKRYVSITSQMKRNEIKLAWSRPTGTMKVVG